MLRAADYNGIAGCVTPLYCIIFMAAIKHFIAGNEAIWL